MKRILIVCLMLFSAIVVAQNALRWEGAPVDEGTVLNLGTTLADDTLSSAGSEWNNSTNLDMLGWFELTTDSGNLFSAAVTQTGATVVLYRIQSMDGTTYDNEPATADIAEFPHLRVGDFPIATEAENKPIIIGPFPLPPSKQKYLVYNDTGQTMTLNWEVNLYTNNPEIQ